MTMVWMFAAPAVASVMISTVDWMPGRSVVTARPLTGRRASAPTNSITKPSVRVPVTCTFPAPTPVSDSSASRTALRITSLVSAALIVTGAVSPLSANVSVEVAVPSARL